MSVEADLRAILTGHAPLIALVPAARIYPVNYGQGAASPAIRYNKIVGVTGLHMQGSDGLTEATFQIDIRSQVRDDVGAVAEVLAIRDVLIGKHGVGGLLHPFRGIVGETDFRVIRLNADRGVQDEKTDTALYQTSSLDFTVWSRAAA